MRAAEEMNAIHTVGVYYGASLQLGATRVDQAYIPNPHIHRLQAIKGHYEPWVKACDDPNGPWGRDGKTVRTVTEGIVINALSVRFLERILKVGRWTVERYLVEGLGTYAAMAGWTE
jgi:hypothetical protein